MRSFIRRAGAACLILLAFAAGAACYALTRAPVFSGGSGYEFSCGDSSSARVVRPASPALYKLFHAVGGESVRYEGDVSARLIEEFSAALVFTEEACGVTNYYLYSPRLGDGIALGGKLVNLHIAVGRGQTAAGTPVIFGGF